MSDDLEARLTRERFPRSAGYDPRWMVENNMGPNPLWLLEWLCTELELRPGARVLDLGCGRAMTSVFLAREFGVRVVAADLWVAPTENWERIKAAGLAEQIMPVHAEAHDLKFARGYFDAVVSVDAYHYFGTDDLYLAYLSQFVAPGGQVGVAVPGLVAELDGGPPEHLAAAFAAAPDFWSFHSPAWWQRQWSRSGKVENVRADFLEDGWRDWLDWCEAVYDNTDDEFARQVIPGEVEFLKADAGRNLGFTRVIGSVPART